MNVAENVAESVNVYVAENVAESVKYSMFNLFSICFRLNLDIF